MVLRTRAPAKINLTLHVLRRRADGFHDLESLVAFAGVADILELDATTPFGLELRGPTAPAAGALVDNLVLKAARALADRVRGLKTGGFRLTKRLPVGAGIGGGSSDAAAALRLLARLNDLGAGDPRLHEAAQAAGSDVPVCVAPRSRMMRGTGDRLGPALRARGLYAVLVNPGVHLDTKRVFDGMGWKQGEESRQPHHPDLDDDLDIEGFVEGLKGARNDMQGAAATLAPEIGIVLDALGALPSVRLARMSGSGSTCFAVFTDRRAARSAAAALRVRNPDWWIRATPLL